MDALLSLAERHDARFIVVGSYGESPLKGAILGSTPHKLLHMSPVPVVVVRRPPHRLARVSAWEKVAGLPVQIDGYSLEGLEQPMGPEFTRFTTLITMTGGGEEGVGEDVVYDGLDHVALQDAGAVHDLSGPRHARRAGRAARHPRPVPGAAGARRVPQLPPLGVRVRRDGPGAAPGGQVAR